MYDRKNEANEFVADSVEEATAAAARFYGMEASELRVHSAPAGEIYGLGGRAAIVAIPKNAKPPTPSSDGGERGGRGGRDRGDRGERRERGGRDRERGGRGKRERGGRGDRGEARADAAPGPLGTTKKNGEVGQVGEFVAGVMERLRIGDVEISESRDGDSLIIQLGGSGVETLHSRDARATDALQMLANQAAKQAAGDDEDAPRVMIEIDGESDDREDSLRELAERALKRARDTSRSIALDPMSSRDRRVIHLAVRDEDGVATMSIGSGRFRQVLVVPEGAPEYEEAQSASD